MNGRINNLVYGSYAPGAPNIFIDDAQWKELWNSPERYYLVASETAMPRLRKLVGNEELRVVLASGSKVLLTNRPMPTSGP